MDIKALVKHVDMFVCFDYKIRMNELLNMIKFLLLNYPPKITSYHVRPCMRLQLS